MLDERLVQNKRQQAERQVREADATLQLEQVLQIISRLEKANMLKAAFTPPGNWILQSEVPAIELVTVLQEHLSKMGWRRVVEAMHRHNREHAGSLLDLAQPGDFLIALERALQIHEQSTPAAAPGEDWTANLWGQVRRLMESQLTPIGVTDLLMSPRALVNRLEARARRANTETQIENAATQTALHAARIVGTDVERDVALKRVEQLRRELGDHLEVFCEDHGLALPRPYSREEAYCLHLLNAYFVALAEAEGAIAKRGAALARRQIALEGQRAETQMDGKLLPGLIEGRRETNPMRESLFRERMRHGLAMVVGGVFSAIAGALWGVVEGVGEVLIASIARYAIVVAPALLIGLLTLVAQTLAYSGQLSMDVVAEFATRALWNGALAFGATILVYGCWLYYRAHYLEEEE